MVRNRKALIMTTKILEVSESLKGHSMMTVRTDRGDEYVIDADAAVIALAELFSTYDNEQRFGWRLDKEWFLSELTKIRNSALMKMDNGEAKLLAEDALRQLEPHSPIWIAHIRNYIRSLEKRK
jgi:hypothetical protein